MLVAAIVSLWKQELAGGNVNLAKGDTCWPLFLEFAGTVQMVATCRN